MQNTWYTAFGLLYSIVAFLLAIDAFLSLPERHRLMRFLTLIQFILLSSYFWTTSKCPPPPFYVKIVLRANSSFTSFQTENFSPFTKMSMPPLLSSTLALPPLPPQPKNKCAQIRSHLLSVFALPRKVSLLRYESSCDTGHCISCFLQHFPVC